MNEHHFAVSKRVERNTEIVWNGNNYVEYSSSHKSIAQLLISAASCPKIMSVLCLALELQCLNPV